MCVRVLCVCVFYNAHLMAAGDALAALAVPLAAAAGAASMAVPHSNAACLTRGCLELSSVRSRPGMS